MNSYPLRLALAALVAMPRYAQRGSDISDLDVQRIDVVKLRSQPLDRRLRRSTPGLWRRSGFQLTCILTLRQAGAAMDTIAETLNAEGVAPRSGGQWYGSTVRNILLQEAVRLCPERLYLRDAV
jgi:hypothetical protein